MNDAYGQEEFLRLPDAELYPAETLNHMGVLYTVNGSLAKTQANFYNEYGKTARHVSFTLNGLSIQVESDSLPAIHLSNPLWVFKQDSSFYYISVSPYSQLYAGKTEITSSFLKLAKRETAELGFKYIALKAIDRKMKEQPYHWTLEIGEYLQRLVTPKSLIEQSDSVVVLQSYVPASKRPMTRYRFDFLRSEPVDSAAFIQIEEPRMGSIAILACENGWLKLQMSVGFPYAPAPHIDAYYMGGTYTGYWKIPYDENGFPYLLIAMLRASTNQLFFNELIEKQNT